MGPKNEPSCKSSALCRPDQAALRVCGKTIHKTKRWLSSIPRSLRGVVVRLAVKTCTGNKQTPACLRLRRSSLAPKHLRRHSVIVSDGVDTYSPKKEPTSNCDLVVPKGWYLYVSPLRIAYPRAMYAKAATSRHCLPVHTQLGRAVLVCIAAWCAIEWTHVLCRDSLTMFCHAESQDLVRTSSPLTWWYVVPPEVGLEHRSLASLRVVRVPSPNGPPPRTAWRGIAGMLSGIAL